MEAALAAYLAPRLEALGPVTVTGLQRIPGGASRETWMFDAGWTSSTGSRESAPFILRKDPPASLLDTDREAEFAFYSAFWESPVPVPRMRWLEQDPNVLGGPFFIMDRVLGCQANQRYILLPPYNAVHEPIARRMYAILGEITKFDWRGTAIERVAEAPAPEAAWEAQLRHWEHVIDTEELSPQPVMRAAIRWLRRNPPPPAHHVSVVHGDYRVGNFLYQEDGTIRGVLDWEMAHLGDPLEDLAWSINQSWQFANDGKAGGIVERETAIALWEDASELKADRDALLWWEVFANVKCQGIWVTGARSYQERRSREPILATIAYGLVNRQDIFLLQTLRGVL